MQKSVAELIDELSITNCKIFALEERVLQNTHTREDAKRISDLNRYRAALKNALAEHFGERPDIKV